jgi:chaperone required for assembly of F1-ATPase
MKRFYTSVSVTADGGIALDNRIVKTPAKVPLLLPNAALAEAVADEWRAQEDVVNPHLMPFTGLANAAIDRVAPDMPAFALGLAAYAECELLCYRAAEPPALVARQDAVWNPVLVWARGRFDISFTLVTGIMHQAQPDRMLSRLAQALATYDAWALAPLNPIITISGSLVLALAVAEGHMAPDAAFDAAHLDELWQAEQWGEDDFALEARALHRRDFLSACHFLNLLDR